MNYKRGFRLATLNRIIAKAGLLTNEIQKAIDASLTTSEQPNLENIPNKPIFAKGSLSISSGVPGVAINVPTNPIIGGETYVDEKGETKYKSGTYNVVGWVKPGKVMDQGLPRPTLTNAIMVTATPVGAAAKSLSSGYTQSFGNNKWWSTAKANIDRAMKKRYGNVSLGKEALAAFSGGYAAVAAALRDGADPDAVIMLDNIHNFGQKPAGPNLDTFTEYAKKAAQDPSKKFISVFSQIIPSRQNKETGRWETYVSSKESAEHIANEVGATTQNESRQIGNLSPVLSMRVGGVEMYSAFPPGKYDVNNMKKQHIAISNAAPDIFNLLADDWNIAS